MVDLKFKVGDEAFTVEWVENRVYISRVVIRSIKITDISTSYRTTDHKSFRENELFSSLDGAEQDGIGKILKAKSCFDSHVASWRQKAERQADAQR